MVEPAGGDAFEALSADELRQRLHALEALIARAPVPIAIAHDRECRVITANRALATLLGVPVDLNISMTPPAGAEPPYRIQREGRDLPATELPMQYAIAHRAPVSNEIEIVRADGSVVYVQNEVEPLFDTHGDVYGCVSVCMDVTERKLAEMGLREADRRKDEFLATLSHELRNPLAPIRTAIEVMRLAREDPDTIEQARATMERQLLHLVRLTDDLLDVARITQNKLELRRARVDLRSVLDSALEAIRPMSDAQEHTVVVDVPDSPLWVDADGTRLSQAFSNILHNAAKYTDRGGQIRVHARSDAGVATITISDTGIGIPPMLLSRIFEMFTQLQPHRDRTHGGLGIGLTLARRLVDLHGGTIQARSEGIGQGTTFIISLPLMAVDGVTPNRSAVRDRQTPAACRVLVGEDNHDAAEMMAVMLRLKGHDVRVACDGLEAVEHARTFRPQIVFLDIGMPRMDGHEAARRIREHLGTTVTLVALTGWGQDEDKRRSREAGFDHHLTKPPEPEVLDRLIDSCAERQRSPQRLEL